MAWRIVFRVDASAQMGSGHVMRCLTLAKALSAQGSEAVFACRSHPGHLGAHIEACGFKVVWVGEGTSASGPAQATNNAAGLQTTYADWLGVSPETDADQCRDRLSKEHWDLLVVDHYALDARWEAKMRPCVSRLVVIDDLANRAHDCDVLIDQNLGRDSWDYRDRVPSGCRLLTGPNYALLRPEFPDLRAASLTRRNAAGLKRILISMGGVDLHNATGRILEVLAELSFMSGLEVCVVMGRSAPWLSEIQAQVARLPFRAEVRVDIRDMAQEMCAADLSIGAAGGTAWERCCLGLPAILVVLADNQRPGAAALERAGAAFVIKAPDEIGDSLPEYLARLAMPDNLLQMQAAAARITDGQGVGRVIETLETLFA
jgi:UDP-2,4-diacetamido-2,4,6-trideoxy-beta-L-altropyranose hydrolase